MVIAVDFDGTIVENNFPRIGKPIFKTIEVLKELQKKHLLILWTCRVDKYLEDAINFCKAFGLNFTLINENVPERKIKYNNDCRKIGADYYIDDKALRPEEIDKLLKG